MVVTLKRTFHRRAATPIHWSSYSGLITVTLALPGSLQALKITTILAGMEAIGSLDTPPTWDRDQALSATASVGIWPTSMVRSYL